MAKGIKITKSGKDISSSTLDDFYMDSAYPLLKVHSYGTFETGVTGLKTITHSLGYIPYVLVFVQFVGWVDAASYITDEFYQCDWLQEGATVTYFGTVKVYDDDIDIAVGNTNEARSGAVDGFYYIFKDEVT